MRRQGPTPTWRRSSCSRTASAIPIRTADQDKRPPPCRSHDRAGVMSDPSRNPLVERAERYVDRRRLIIGLCAAVIVALIAGVPGILTSDDSGRNVRTAEFAQVTPTTAAVPPAGILNPLTPQQVNAPADASPTTTAPASVLGTTFTRP